ncbi:MAG: hypothetical protein RR643_04970 [Anaerorhabdus sp.]|uniref:hypothetical protein n=1 Tax=Anaerorhabdus sp. TaxID=1872524 RepID=UPI002FC98A14
MNLWVIGRDGVISEATEVYNYEISYDYITTEKTSFNLVNDIEFKNGDFVMAKYQHGKGIAYFGVIDSYEESEEDNTRIMVCNDIITLINFDFPATKMSGPSFEAHAKTLITKYLISDPNKVMSVLDIEVLSNTPHVYQPADPPTPTNLMKYLINGFKKYNVVWEFDRFENGRVKTSIKAVTSTVQLKNNIKGFKNWDVSTTEVGKGTSNYLMIVDKTTTNSETPKVLSNWYLLSDNTISQNASSPLVIKPTKTQISIYDTTEEDKPSYEDVANAALKGSFYAHEITVQAYKENLVMDPSSLATGTLVNIMYNGTQYKSVLTGFTINENSDYMALRFGHIRSRLSEILE